MRKEDKKNQEKERTQKRRKIVTNLSKELVSMF